MITRRLMDEMMTAPFLDVARGETVPSGSPQGLAARARALLGQAAQLLRRAADECRVPAGSPAGGQFSECGIPATQPTGPGLAEGNHPDAAFGRKLVRGWVADSNSRMGVAMKLGVRDELKARGSVYDPEKAAGRINGTERVQARMGARAIYETTQAKLIKEEFPDEGIVLYRGIDKPRARRNVLESWTADPKVAAKFGKHVMEVRVTRQQIFAYHDSPIWSRQYEGEREYVIMPGLKL